MDELDELVVRVRADTRGFDAGLAGMKAALDGPFASGVEAAGRSLETALGRAVRTGKFGFDDLRVVAVRVLGDIAAAALKTQLGGIGGGGGGLLGALVSAAGTAFGLPGRATGGPVSGGRGYLVGERGPELFVPTSAGRVETLGGRGAVSVTVNVAAPRDAGPAFMSRTGAQVARSVRRALERAEG